MQTATEILKSYRFRDVYYTWSKTIGSRIVILPLFEVTGRAFEITGPAADFFALLAEGASSRSIEAEVKKISEAHSVSSATIESDLRVFLEDLSERGIVVREEAFIERSASR